MLEMWICQGRDLLDWLVDYVELSDVDKGGYGSFEGEAGFGESKVERKG